MHDRDPTLGLIISKHIEDACLRTIVEHWHPLMRLDLTMHIDDLIATAAWKSLTRAMTYLLFLRDQTYYLPSIMRSIPILNPSVFSAFWVTLTTLYRSTHLNNQLALARWTDVLLKEFNSHASRLAVCKEMDGFYQSVEEMRSAAPSEHQEFISVLNVSIAYSVSWSGETEHGLL
jgi:hypothetical protein